MSEERNDLKIELLKQKKAELIWQIREQIWKICKQKDLENSQPLYIVKNEKADPKRMLKIWPSNCLISMDIPISTVVRSYCPR